MKKHVLIKTFILVLVISSAILIMLQGLADAQTGFEPSTEMDKPLQTQVKKEEPSEKETPGMEEDDFFAYEQDFFSRKLFRRELPKLSKRDHIIWSFRLADTNTFL